jgi:predicted nucleotidyltransferase
MNIQIQIQKLAPLFKEYPEIKLAYFFGSKATGSNGPLSDYDFALHVETNDIKKAYTIKFNLIDKLTRRLKTDAVDVVILNLSRSPEFKYHVIRTGELIYEQEPFKILIEPRILNEYFDFHNQLKRYGLTKA